MREAQSIAIVSSRKREKKKEKEKESLDPDSFPGELF